MNIRSLLAAATALALLAPAARAADILYPNTGASTPSTGDTGRPVEQGRKAILFTMQCLDPVTFVQKNTCWPLAGGTPAVSINGGAPISCAAGLNPAPNACGFAIGSFTAADPNVDTFKVVYNGNFPNNAPVTVTVSGATGNAGSTESNCPNAADPGCTLSFSVGANTPRANATAELVLDVSGSMALPTVPAGSVQRIAALKLAVNTFLGAYGPKTMLGDQLGTVSFTTDATAFPANPVAGNDPAQIAPITANINGLAPTALTAIGKGLNAAASGFAGGNTKWVFLFTDGEQNVAPNVAVSGNQLQIGGATYSTSSAGVPGAGQTWVCPITAGRMTAPGFALLQSIANGFCAGQNAYISNGSGVENFAVAELQTYFMQRLNTMLVGDKFEISRDVAGTVATTPSVTFIGNKLDRSLQIVLTYAQGADRAGYKLIAPDGTEVPVRPDRFLGGSVANIPLPVVIGKKRLPSGGKWQVVFNRDTFGNAPVFHLVVTNDNPTISTTFGAVGSDLGTGDPLVVQATILDRGKPLPNAQVTVDVTGPNAGLGNVLSQARDQGSIPDLGGDASSSPGLRKLLGLFLDPSSGKLFGDSPRGGLKMHFCRSSDDKAASKDMDRDCARSISIDRVLLGSGLTPVAFRTPRAGAVYVSNFSGASLEGHYFFTFHARGVSAGNGPFERTWKLAVFVRPKPFGPKTPVLVESVSPAEGAFVGSLRVTPRDRLGNLIGPGYDGALEFVGDSTGPFPFTRDNLDGSYTFSLDVPAGKPKLTLRTLGQPVKTIDLTGAAQGKTL